MIATIINKAIVQGIPLLFGSTGEIITEKSGNLVGVKAVGVDDEVMLINTEGIIIRIKVSDTALLGRVTSGVKLINLKEGVTVASIAKVREDKTLMNEEEIAEEEKPSTEE